MRLPVLDVEVKQRSIGLQDDDFTLRDPIDEVASLFGILLVLHDSNTVGAIIVVPAVVEFVFALGTEVAVAEGFHELFLAFKEFFFNAGISSSALAIAVNELRLRIANLIFDLHIPFPRPMELPFHKTAHIGSILPMISALALELPILPFTPILRFVFLADDMAVAIGLIVFYLSCVEEFISFLSLHLL